VSALPDVVVFTFVVGVAVRYLSEAVALLVLVWVAATGEGRRAARAERLFGVLRRRSTQRK